MIREMGRTQGRRVGVSSKECPRITQRRGTDHGHDARDKEST